MTQVKLYRIKLKKEGKDTWLNWCEGLKKRKEEVIETLRSEGVVSESCFLSEDGKYIYYFMEAEDFEKAHQAGANSSFAIDAEHKVKKRASFEKGEPLKELFHFENRISS